MFDQVDEKFNTTSSDVYVRPSDNKNQTPGVAILSR